MPVRAKIRASTIERLLDDVEEWANHVHLIRQKMRRVRAGGETYVDHLPDLAVELNGLEEKVRSAAHAIDDEFLEALPEDDE
ncbi:MAG: hypothetical protein ACRD10_15230 [Terriglobia bacterium]